MRISVSRSGLARDFCALRGQGRSYTLGLACWSELARDSSRLLIDVGQGQRTTNPIAHKPQPIGEIDLYLRLKHIGRPVAAAP
jgi:hypothetical protein